MKLLLLHHCCNTLQHTAKHCMTLQHTATHCNTLHHTATHCNILLHIATHCNTLQHTATHCTILPSRGTEIETNIPAAPWLQHTPTHFPQAATHCNTLQHPATHCNTLPYTATHSTHEEQELKLMLLLQSCHISWTHLYRNVLQCVLQLLQCALQCNAVRCSVLARCHHSVMHSRGTETETAAVVEKLSHQLDSFVAAAVLAQRARLLIAAPTLPTLVQTLVLLCGGGGREGGGKGPEVCRGTKGRTVI